MGNWTRFLKIMKDRYGWLWLSIVVTTAGILAVQVFIGWEHWILAAEMNLLIQFAVFWTLQTVEHWSNLEAPDRLVPEPYQDVDSTASAGAAQYNSGPA